MLLKRIVPVLLIFALLSAPVMAAPGPMDQIRSTVEAIIGVLKDASLSKEVRRQKIRSIIEPRFHFRAMSQGALAAYWKKANAEEKEKFVELFSDLLEATYIGRIEAYTDEKVSYNNEKVKGKRAEVDTHIVTKSANIPIIYKLTPKDGHWLVYDILVEGVSLVRNFRSSYGEIVRREGMQGLLAQMETKIAALNSGAPN